MYTVQNKVLPGAYINFVSAARASATLGDRGTAAFPLSLDWGPENEVVTIENSEFQKGSLALTGYAYTADELRPLREIFANAKTLHLFRLNSGGAKAACKYAEAKYPGKIGNELKIVIQQNEGFTASTNEAYDVSTYIGTTLVDTQKAVKAVSDLSDNDYLHWKGSEALTENAGLLLTEARPARCRMQLTRRSSTRSSRTASTRSAATRRTARSRVCLPTGRAACVMSRA